MPPKKGELTGCDLPINTSKLSGIYGTVDKYNTTSFYINLGTWLSIDSNIDDKIALLNKLESYTKNYMRAIAPSLHPDYLYSFIDANIGSSFGIQHAKGHIDFEITVMVTNPVEDIRYNEIIRKNIQGFAELIQDKLESFDGLTISKRRIKQELV